MSRPAVSKAVALGCVAVALIGLAPVVASVMHDNDQASLLLGAERLVQGAAAPWSADFYNYDKQYATYWILALLRRAFPRADFVAAGNILSFSVFWTGFLVAVACGRVRRIEQLAGLGACVGAPAVLLHSPFMGTSSISAGFLLMAWAAWPRTGRTGARRVIALSLIGLAVGCRADAILVLPWLAWTTIPAGNWRTLCRRPGWYWIGATGLVALILGKAFYRGVAIDSYPPFLIPKLYAAYLVFGLGAAAGVLIWFCLALLAIVRTRLRNHRPGTEFYSLGLISLLVPWAFYSGQLYSTRYWTPVLCALIGGLVSPRGAVLTGWTRHRRIIRFATTAVAAGTFIPLFVGLHLPFPNKPSLVISDPTLFPTGDGLQPMGAMVSFLRRLVLTAGHVVDHNQAIWLSATHARFEPDQTGRVPILEAPLESYLLLAVTLQGMTPGVVSEQAPRFYTDARDMLRVFRDPDRLRPVSRLAVSQTLAVHPVAPETSGYVIVQADHFGPREEWWLEQLRLAHAVHGNEFQLRPELSGASGFAPPRRDEGKTVLLFSRQPFTVLLRAANGTTKQVVVRRTEDPILFLAVVPGADWFGARFNVSQGNPRVAVTLHPDYMSVDRL